MPADLYRVPEPRTFLPTHLRVTFDDFSDGEFGSEAPWRAPKTSFTGTNVLRYVDGSLGPRNGLIAVSLSGASLSGVIAGMGFNLAGAAISQAFWLIIGTNVYLMHNTGVVTAAGTVASIPTEPPAFITRGAKTYISSYNDKLYKIDHNAATTTAIASPNTPGLRCFAQYGERTMAGGQGKAPDGTTAPSNRLYFSDAGNPESWPAANFIDIGNDGVVITAIVPQRTHLVVCTDDGGWWVLTGVPGVNPVLRPALQSVSPFYPNHVCPIGNGNLGYTIASSTTNGSTASLGVFTGSQIALNEKLNFGDGRRTAPLPTYQAVPLKNADDWFVQGGKSVAPNSMALFQLGCWTLHQWQVSGVTLQGYCMSDTVADQHLFTDGGAVSTAPKFYLWRAYSNRPAFTSDTGLGQPGDASTTPFTANFTLPEWYSEDGREASVVEVVVDFTSWNTGSASTNHFDLTPTVLRTYNAGSVTGSTVTFDEAGSSSAATIAGTRQRKRFGFSHLPAGNGFTLAFAALRGVAIQKVQVHLEYDKARF